MAVATEEAEVDFDKDDDAELGQGYPFVQKYKEKLEVKLGDLTDKVHVKHNFVPHPVFCGDVRTHAAAAIPRSSSNSAMQIVDQLRVLNRSIFPVRYNDKFYTDVQNSGSYTKLAYYSTDILVGAICCRLEKPPPAGPGASSGGAGYGTKLYIMTIGVLSPYRSCGIGTKLLKASLADAEADPHVSEAYLHVQTSNQDAINFYQRFGFSVASTIKNYYKRIDPPDCHVLVKKFSR